MSEEFVDNFWKLCQFLIHSISPFKRDSDEDTRNNIYDADYDFNHEIWKETITVDAIDFVHMLIQREPGMRMKSHHALTHKWLQPVYGEVNKALTLLNKNQLFFVDNNEQVNDIDKTTSTLRNWLRLIRLLFAAWATCSKLSGR